MDQEFEPSGGLTGMDAGTACYRFTLYPYRTGNVPVPVSGRAKKGRRFQGPGCQSIWYPYHSHGIEDTVSHMIPLTIIEWLRSS